MDRARNAELRVHADYNADWYRTSVARNQKSNANPLAVALERKCVQEQVQLL